MQRNLKNWLQKAMLPRATQYQKKDVLYDGWREVLIAHEGKALKAYFRHQTSSKLGIVILCHPYVISASQFFLERGHADMYFSLGYDVCIFDFNGFGLSNFNDFNFWQDIKIVFDYIRIAHQALPIHIHGISFGAAQIILFLAREKLQDVNAIIENCLDQNTSYYKVRNRKIYWFFKVLMAVIPGFNREHIYTKTIRGMHNKNTLFIYNEQDSLTTIEMGEKLYQSLPTTHKKFIILEGKHLEAITLQPDRYREEIVTFLTQNQH